MSPFEDAVEVPQNLGDVPDLSGMTEDRPEAWEDGWYIGTIDGTRTVATREGNTLNFTTEDVLSQQGDSRNIFVQLTVRRKLDGRSINLNHCVNYRTENLTPTVIASILKRKEEVKAGGAEWAELFGPFMQTVRIGTLQRIAGLKSFEHNLSGGFDVSALAGKSCFVRLGDDKRKPQYKAAVELSDTAPKKKQVL